MAKKTAVEINKISWKKINDQLSHSGLNDSEINTLDSLFNALVEHHTDLGELIFTRQYLYSVLIRLHNYLKETRLIQNAENLKDTYDYILTNLILTIELCANYSLDYGISIFISRIMTKIFNIEAVNNACMILDNRYRMRQKYVIEPVISNKNDKITLEKAKDFIDFIFNLFSYCDSSNRCVSISILCSSLWVKDFFGIPYLVDDSIITNFSSDSGTFPILNTFLLQRRDAIIKTLSGGETNLDLGDYSLEEYLISEPEEFYEELKTFLKDFEEKEEFDEEEDLDEIDQENIISILTQLESEESELPPEMENEIRMIDSFLTDLNKGVNGVIPKSDISLESLRRKRPGISYPRLRTLFTDKLREDATIKDIFDDLQKIEDERVKKKVPDRERIVKDTNAIIKDIEEKKKEKENLMNSLPPLPNSYFEQIFNSKETKEMSQWFDFRNYMDENISIYSKGQGKLNKSVIVGMIDWYNTKAKPKLKFKNIKENEDGSITLDHVKGKAVIDHCIIKDGKMTCEFINKKAGES